MNCVARENEGMNAGFNTRAVHAGRADLTDLGVHALPIDLSTTNPLPDIDAGGASYEQLASGGDVPEGGSAVYARLWNPTVARFETALANLEGAEAAVAFSSGMAGITAMLMSLTQGRGKPHVVAVRPLYGGTDYLLASGLLGTEVTFCDAGAVAEAITPKTGLVLLETPANPTLELVDIAAVVDQAGEVPVAVDNTFATPVLQRPLEQGAALSFHSATKYLGGHGDAVGGVVACSTELATLLRQTRAITGGILHPLAAYLFHRGLTTLPVRIRAQQEAARQVAARLTEHPEVERVYFPGTGADADLLGAQMAGPGAMVSIKLRGGYAAAEKLTSNVEVFTHAVSLGGVDSLIQHPAALTHRPVAPEARPGADVVRMSIGLEDPADLIADLERALA